MKCNVYKCVLLCTVVQAGVPHSIIKRTTKLKKHAPTHFSNFGARETCIMFLERKEQTALCGLLYALHDRLNYADLRMDGVARKGIGENFPSYKDTLKQVMALSNNHNINEDERLILSLYHEQIKTLHDYLNPNVYIVKKNQPSSKDPITFDEKNLFFKEFSEYKKQLKLVLAKEISS